MARLLILVVLLLGISSAGRAEPEQAELFTTLDERVVALGTRFSVEVEVVVAPAAEAADWREALAGAVFEASGAFEVVHADTVRLRHAQAAGVPVAVLARRFVLRPLQEGALEVPPLAFEVGGQAYRTRPQRILAYVPPPRLYRTMRAVLPLAAELGGAVRIGSGFLMAEDAVVTAYHVVVGAGRVRLELPDGTRLVTRKVWAVDPARDVAVLHVDPQAVRRAGLVPLAMAPDFELGRAGDVAFTAGWPGGLQRTGAGIRSTDLHPAEGETIWVSSNRVEPGDSGGPLLDRQGRVIGVIASGRAAPRGGDYFGEDVCLASDPRPALALRRQASRPHSLRDVLTAQAQRAPHARVLETVAALTQARWRSGKHAHTVATLRHVAAEAPRDAAFQFLLGTALDEVGEAEAAAAAYRTALDAFGGYFPAAYALGYHHLRRGEFRAAEYWFDQTSQHAAYGHLAALGLARAYAGQLRYAEAEQVLLDVLGRDAHFAPALYLLGYCRLALGRRTEAAALVVHLDGLSEGWAEQLRLLVREPVLQPVALAALPPVPLRR